MGSDSRRGGDAVDGRLIVLGGYLLGSIPFGYVLPRLFRGEDVREPRSGDFGASNVFRM